MRRLITGLTLAVAMAAAAIAQEVRVEFRPAAEAAADGLVEMQGADGATYYVTPEPILTNEDIAEAKAAFDPSMSIPVVHIRFTEEGGKKFAAFTQDNVLGLIAIILDGELVSAPRINEPILGGQAMITGNFTLEEAERIARGIVPGRE